MMQRTQQIQGGPGGLFTFGASKAKLYDVKRPSVTFNDVAGLDNAKQELRKSIEFLKNPAKYTKIGAAAHSDGIDMPDADVLLPPGVDAPSDGRGAAESAARGLVRHAGCCR